MAGLTQEQIHLLLQEDAQTSRATGRRNKVDLTADRSYNGWFRLQHHLCTSDCAHRLDPANPTVTLAAGSDPASPTVEAAGNACWNPNCLDHTRDKETDRGVNIVFPVGPNKHYVCRFCYLGGYLADGS